MISVLYNIILITNFKLIEMCIKSSPGREGAASSPTPLQEERGSKIRDTPMGGELTLCFILSVSF